MHGVYYNMGACKYHNYDTRAFSHHTMHWFDLCLKNSYDINSIVIFPTHGINVYDFFYGMTPIKNNGVQSSVRQTIQFLIWLVDYRQF